MAAETPVAIEVNGAGYAVLMATPADLEDLAFGFALSERLIDGAADVRAIDVAWVDAGAIVRLLLDDRVADRIAGRVRHRTGESACGLCGIENLEQAMRPLPRVSTRWAGDEAAVFRAAATMGDRQAMGRATRAAHAAAECAADGAIALVREDVGRHNAFDKLVGAMLRDARGWDGGFALLTSRCSYELVEKAVLAGCPMLATVSLPTDLALTRAAGAGLPLRVLVRDDAMLAAP